jgi:hypothetical protein
MSVDAGTDEAVGLKRLNESVFRPGDIVLTTTTVAVSKVIRVATRSDISHASPTAERHGHTAAM